jgi:hypothetical protein
MGCCSFSPQSHPLAVQPGARKKKGVGVNGVESTILPLLRKIETQLAALWARVVEDLDLRKELLLLHDRVVKLERRVAALERPKGRVLRKRR